MSFIFQTKFPKVLSSKGTVAWVASRYREQMRKGDVVYFWLAHKDPSLRGIYGWGIITAQAPRIDERGVYRIDVEHRCIFREHWKKKHITIWRIRNDPVLRDLLISRMAIGTNFLLTDEEDEAIRLIIGQEYGQDWLPPKQREG